MAWTKFSGKSILGHVCHWLSDEVSHQSSKHKSLCLLGFCVVPRKGSFNIPNPTKLGKTELQGSNPRKATEIMMLSMESRLNSSGTSSQDSQRCSSVIKSMIYWATMGQTPETYTGRILFMSMFNDISCDRKGNKDECLANAETVKVLARRFGIGQWSFIGPGSEKKWYSSENSPQGAWDDTAEQMLLEFAESGHPTFRATTPLSRGILKSKGRGKLSIHFAADVRHNWYNLSHYSFCQSAQCLRSSGSYMRGIWGAIKIEQGEPVILVGQSIVLGEVKAETPLHDEDPMNDQIIWQQYIQQIESLSPENKVSRFCKEAGFMRVVEVGQYFVTTDTGEF